MQHKCSIVTGMGITRVATFHRGFKSLFETFFFSTQHLIFFIVQDLLPSLSSSVNHSKLFKVKGISEQRTPSSLDDPLAHSSLNCSTMKIVQLWCCGYCSLKQFCPSFTWNQLMFKDRSSLLRLSSRDNSSRGAEEFRFAFQLQNLLHSRHSITANLSALEQFFNISLSSSHGET